MSSVTSRPQPSAVLTAITRKWRRILAAQDIVDDSRLIRFVLVGFDIRAAQASEVIQHKMNAMRALCQSCFPRWNLAPNKAFLSRANIP